MKVKKQSTESISAWIAAFKFVPLIIFACMVIVFHMDLLLAAPIATFSAVIVYMIVKRTNFETSFEKCLDSVRHIVLIFFILMFAYAVAECFMATGVGAALINLALELGVTARTVALVAMLVTCLLSIATGSSWGTFAACAPIFLWLNHLVGGNILLTLASVAGGSCYGDNIGMISDVTVLSCGMQDVKIIDRLKHQLFWAFGCLALGMLVVFFAGMSLPNAQGDVAAAIAQIPGEARLALAEERPSALALLEQVEAGVPYYMIIPLIVVIALSFMKLHTMLCLAAGMISSLILGCFAGTTTFSVWLNDLLYTGFSDAGSWVIVMMIWVSAFGGIMNSMNAFEPLSRLVVKLSRNVQQLMGWCGILCLAGNAALADEAAQVATISPIVRDIVERNVDCDEEAAYTLRLRLATFTSAMGIYGSEMIPWHCFPVYFAGIASAVYPLREFSPVEIIGHNYLSFIIVGSILLLTFTGLDRFVPMFGLPNKNRARLIKHK
ncbi:MAG: Na+/H+ antiporter NhaC family protein [Ruminococcaceae bacterium]|nr:Na+/H+ antiporter NhaC family protein [Oscillospiraceae bacterium]